MKKTTLSKLVKQALKEVILEQTDFSKNRLRVTSETLKDLSIPLTLKEQREVEASLGIDKDKINQTFEFLRDNSEQGTPLEKIANDPLLKGINIDGLGAIYKNIPTLTLEEWIGLLPTLTGTGNSMSCPSTPSYGSISIYNTNTCLSELVDDRFICCSDNNPLTNQLQAGTQYSFPNSNNGIPGFWNISGNNQNGSCYCPSGILGDCLGSNLNQFTYTDFVAWMSNSSQGNAIGGNSQPNGMCPTNIPFVGWEQCYSSAANSGCGGCAHDKADNYVSTGGGTPLGCPDQYSNFLITNLDCCVFTGCGAIGTVNSGITPQADNVGFANSNCSGTSCASTNVGVPDAQADEQQVYWNDGAGPDGIICTFPIDGCSTFTIPGVGQPTNWNGSNTPGLVWHDTSYNYQNQSGVDSPHLGVILTTPTSPVCTVKECLDDNLDPTGVNSALLTSANSTGNTWVSGPPGTYNLPAPGYILSNKQNKCEIQGCTDEFNGSNIPHVNWLDPTLFPNITIQDDPSYCKIIDPGCGPVGSVTGIGWSNYMATATSMNGECQYNGCTEYSALNAGSAQYVCTLHPFMCDMTLNGGAGGVDLTLPDIVSSTNPFPHDQSSCLGISGCTDDGAIHANDLTWWTGNNAANKDYATATGAAYGGLGAPTNYNLQHTLEDGSCNWEVNGCTLTGASNLDVNSTNITYVEDGSCNFNYCYSDNTATNYFCATGNYPQLCTAGNVFDPTLVASVTDDNSCTGGTITGCTDINACNITPGATVDDGSCTYPDGNCDCLGNPPAGDCDCNGEVDLGCGCDVLGPDCNQDCPGDPGYPAVIDDCQLCGGTAVNDPSQWPSVGHNNPGDNGFDCAGTCNGSGEEDDCGVCHSGGQSIPTLQHTDPNGVGHYWNACEGCEYDLAGSGGTYNQLHTQDTTPGSCLFTACVDNTTTPLSTNYICLTRPDLCLDAAGTGPCNASDHTCEVNDDLGTWTQASCTIPPTGCRDAGGVNTWGTGTNIFGPYINGVNVNYPGAANNYNPGIGVGGECDGSSTISAYQCKPGPDGVPQTYNSTPPLSTDNPDGCCCTYTPGCTDQLYVEYLGQGFIANQDDGSCQTPIEDGCTNPGFGNFSPTATQEDGSCVYDGCVDSGNWSDGTTFGNGMAVYLNYACYDSTSVVNVVDVTLGTTVIPAGTPKPVWEWLGCNVLGAAGNFNIQYGTFTDGTVFNSSTGVNLYDPLDVILPAGAEPGQCTGYTGGAGGCFNDGNPTYIQNDGMGNLTPYAPGSYDFLSSQDDGSCKYGGCTDPLALNYFCVDNSNLCDMTQNSGAGAIDSSFGTLAQTSNYSCVFTESYNCDTNLGCNDPGDGSGTYTTLLNCETACTTVSFNCNPTGCVDPLDGSGTYNISNAAAANFFLLPPNTTIGDPLGYCDDNCTASTFDCDPTTGCFDPGTGNGQFSNLLGPNGCQANCLDECVDVKAVKCGNPYSQPGGQQAVYDFSCITIDGSLPALGTNDRFLLPNLPPDGPVPVGPVVSEQIKVKSKYPDSIDNSLYTPNQNAGTCYEVVMVTPSTPGNQTDYPSCVCPDPTFPPTYDCCTYATCPGTFQLNYGPGSDWAINNPGLPTPTVNPNFKFCQERLDGSGEFSTLTDCTLDCEEIYGCTDSSATNYDPLATIDDGSCVYTDGCTNPQANNYDPLATVDDGSCDYTGLIGCANPTAQNYNSNNLGCDPDGDGIPNVGISGVSVTDDSCCIMPPTIQCPAIGLNHNEHKCKHCGWCESSNSYRTANPDECACCDDYRTNGPANYYCQGCSGKGEMRTYGLKGIHNHGGNYPIPGFQHIKGNYVDFTWIDPCKAAQWLGTAFHYQYPSSIYTNSGLKHIAAYPAAGLGFGACVGNNFEYSCGGSDIFEGKNNNNLILEQRGDDGSGQLPSLEVLETLKGLSYNEFSSFVAENPNTWHLGYPRPLDTETDPELDPKDIDVDTVEPVDIDRPTEPTGSADVPERPTITPDTPELKESKKLRKLIKKWRKNNL